MKPNLKRSVRALVAALTSSVLLSACSKTVQWEEEVLLNTGETIWVKRAASYAAMGGAGNPLDIQYRIQGAPTLEFDYSGKKYSFKENAGLMVLAISPNKTPILVAVADAGAWNWNNNYFCVTPFYVQFVPDADGHKWTWPPQIETWLYNLPTNLFADYGMPDGIVKKYTREQKAGQQYLLDPQLVSSHKINSSYSSSFCKVKEK